MSLYSALARTIGTAPPADAPVCLPPRPAQPGPPPPAWFTVSFGDADRIREERILDDLAELTERLDSPLAAAQHLYAQTETTNA